MPPPDVLAFYAGRIERCGEPVLELMSGSGCFLVRLVGAGFDIDGVDASADMLGHVCAGIRAMTSTPGFTNSSCTSSICPAGMRSPSAAEARSGCWWTMGRSRSRWPGSGDTPASRRVAPATAASPTAPPHLPARAGCRRTSPGCADHRAPGRPRRSPAPRARASSCRAFPSGCVGQAAAQRAGRVDHPAAGQRRAGDRDEALHSAESAGRVAASTSVNGAVLYSMLAGRVAGSEATPPSSPRVRPHTPGARRGLRTRGRAATLRDDERSAPGGPNAGPAGHGWVDPAGSRRRGSATFRDGVTSSRVGSDSFGGRGFRCRPLRP